MAIYRLKKETWKHKQAFETYLMMGPGRSLGQLSKMIGNKTSTISLWSSCFGWQAKLQAADSKAITRLQEEDEKAYLEKVKRRHLESYQKVLAKSMKQINSKKLMFDSDKDAAIAMDIAIKGEREVMGLRNTNIKGAIVKEGFAALLSAVTGPEEDNSNR